VSALEASVPVDDYVVLEAATVADLTDLILYRVNLYPELHHLIRLTGATYTVTEAHSAGTIEYSAMPVLGIVTIVGNYGLDENGNSLTPDQITTWNVIERSPTAPVIDLFHIAAGGRLTLYNVRLVNGGGASRMSGGAIVNDGELYLYNSQIVNNNSNFWGGGIHNAGTLVAINTEFIGNNAVDTVNYIGGGGSAIINYGSLEAYSSTFQNNRVSPTIQGGSIYVPFTVPGGAIYNESPNISVHYSNFIGNTADGQNPNCSHWPQYGYCPLHIRDFASTVPADASNNYWSQLDSMATWGSVTTTPTLSVPVSYGEHSGEGDVCFVPKPPQQIDFTNIRFNGAHAPLKSLMFWLMWNELSEDRYYFGGDAQIGTANSPITDQRDQISRQLASFLIDTPYCVSETNQASGEQPGTLNWDDNVVRIEHCEDHRYMMAQVLINAFIDYERKVTWYDPDVPEQLMAVIYGYGYTNFVQAVRWGDNSLWDGYGICQAADYFSDWPKTLISRDGTETHLFSTYKEILDETERINQRIGECGTGDECLASFPHRWQVQALAVLWLDEYLSCRSNVATDNPYWTHFQDASPRIITQIDRAIDDFYAQKPDPTDGAWGRLNANRLPTDNPHTISLATVSLGLDSPQADVKNLYDERPGGTGVCPLTKSGILNYIHSPAMDHIDQVRDCYPPINPVVLQPLLWLDVSAAEAQTPAGYRWATASYVRLQGEHLQRYVDICATYGRCLDGQSQ
jgi:hypothetical protein